jgi:hypothetical protein
MAEKLVFGSWQGLKIFLFAGLSFTQGPPLVPVLRQTNQVHIPHPISLRPISIFFSHLRLCLPSGLFPYFPTKISQFINLSTYLIWLSIYLSLFQALCLPTNSLLIYPSLSLQPPNHSSSHSFTHTQAGAYSCHCYPYHTFHPQYSPTGIPNPSCEGRKQASKTYGHTSSTKDLPRLILFKCHNSQNLNPTPATRSIAL